jgi:hypothetical protein
LFQIMWGGMIPYYTTFYLCKASLLSMYLQLFPCFMTKRRILLWVTIAYCSLAYVVTISLQLFLCFPIERNWQAMTCPLPVPSQLTPILKVRHRTRASVRPGCDSHRVPDRLGVAHFREHHA